MNKEATMKVSLQLKLTHTRHATSIGPGNIVIYDERVKSTSLDKFKSIVDCFLEGPFYQESPLLVLNKESKWEN